MQGGQYYKILNVDSLPPFFISIVSSSDHWLFISSTGGLSAGRINADHALFPYYTEDKLTENNDNTGNKTIFIVHRQNRAFLWEPFSIRQQGQYHIERSLYKHTTGTSLIFEEINLDLGSAKVSITGSAVSDPALWLSFSFAARSSRRECR